MRFDSNTFEKLARQVLDDFRADKDPVVDLASATFLTLPALSKLVALLYTLYRIDPRSSERVRFRAPNSTAGWVFLLDTRFFSLVAHSEVFILASEFAHTESKYLLDKNDNSRRIVQRATSSKTTPYIDKYPAMAFRRVVEGGSTVGRELFESMLSGFIGEIDSTFSEALSSHLGYSPDEARPFLLVNSEIYTNIYYHSGSWGYAAIQCNRDGLSIVYGDLGIGFAASLAGQREDICEQMKRSWNDVTAILGSFEFGISSKSQGRAISGMGLGTVRELVMQRRGVLECRSGTGRVIFKGDGSREGKTRCQEVENMVGAQLSIFLPTRKRYDRTNS